MDFKRFNEVNVRGSASTPDNKARSVADVVWRPRYGTMNTQQRLAVARDANSITIETSMRKREYLIILNIYTCMHAEKSTHQALSFTSLGSWQYA